MTFVDRIADAQDLADVFELVNEFIEALYRSAEADRISLTIRRISTADNLMYWFDLVSAEIKRQEAAEEKTPDVVFDLHAVLETAIQRCASRMVSLRWRDTGPAGAHG
jgi:DNA-binding GntR family transcriptional regulator